jgi:hypothetical protein
MKTFEQFLSEAQRPAFASQRDIRGAERHLQSPEASQTREHPVIARIRAKEESQRTGARGTSISDSEKQSLRAKAEEEKQKKETEQTAEQEKKDTLAKARELLATQQTPEEIAKRKKAIQRSEQRRKRTEAQRQNNPQT